MIPKNMRSKDMVGMEVKTARAIKNGAGIVVSKGKIVKIASFGRAFTIRTEDCPHCGLSAYISGVTRDDVELISGSDKKKTNADRIREMTNEELAGEFVCSYMSIVDGEAYPIYEAVHEGCQYETREDAEKAELEWLESECDAE